MSSIGRDVLTRKAGFKRATVAVPEWGGDVLIRELSAGEILEVARIQTQEGASTSAILAFLLVSGWVDDSGANLFTHDDSAQLLALPAGIVTRIAGAVSELSGAGVIAGSGTDSVTAAKNA